MRARLLRYEQSPDELLLSTLVTGWQPDELRAAARGPLADALAWYDPLDAVRPISLAAPPDEVGLVDAMRYLDFKTTLGAGILTKVDRASMAVALEVRPVFLHRDVLSLARRIPAALLSTGTEAKALLRAPYAPGFPPRRSTGRRWASRCRSGAGLRRPGSFGALADDRPAAARSSTPPRSRASRASTRPVATARRRLHAVAFLDHWLERWA